MSQTIINNKDRSVSFWKFLILFIFSSLFIVFACFFDFNLSSKETTVLRSEVERYRTQEAAQAKFVKGMDQTKSLIDSLNVPGVNNAYLNQQIVVKIRELTELQYKDSSFYTLLNKNIIDVFLRYQEATNKVIKYADAPKQLEEIKVKYEQSQRDLDAVRNDNELLRRSANVE